MNNILLQLHFIYPTVLYCMRAKSHYSINIKCDCSLNFYFLNEATESQPWGVNSLSFNIAGRVREDLNQLQRITKNYVCLINISI